MNPVKYAFLDLETTGLDEKKGSILEAALILTDEHYKATDIYEVVVRPLPGYGDMDPVVLDMHTKNGLLRDVEERGIRRYQAEELLVRVVKESVPEDVRPMLAGNSIWFDKLWLREHMPTLHDLMHYRVLDVTSISQFALSVDQALFNGRPRSDGNHRAMSDVRNSVDTMIYYRQQALVEPEPIDCISIPRGYQT